MVYSGNFSIIVSGDPIKESSILGFEAQVHNRALRVDENVVLIERNFMKITYTMTWEGIPKDIVALSHVWSTIKRIIDTYLVKWSYEIKIDMVEKEGGQDA